MDDFNGRIRDLTNQIERLERENRKALRNYQRNLERELALLQNRTQKENQSQLRALEKEYRKKFHEYERFMRGEITSLEKEVQNEIRKKNIAINNLKKEMREIEKQLKSQIEHLKKEMQDDQERKREIAEQYVQVFKNLLDEFDELPHRIFIPGKVDNIANVQDELNRLEKLKMYEAESATAISQTSALHRLQIELNEQKENWEREYQIYKQNVSHLCSSLSEHLSHWNGDYVQSIQPFYDEPSYQISFSQSVDECVTEVDFWSFGEYRLYFERLKEEMNLISIIEEQGIDCYLLQQEAMPTSSLIIKNTEIHQLNDQIYDVYDKAKDNQVKYLLRKDMMKKILQGFEVTRHMKIVGIKIGAVQDEDDCYKKYKALSNNTLVGDTRQILHGILLTQAKTYIHIFIRPEDLETSYRNVIILYDDFGKHQRYLATIERDDYMMLVRILNRNGLEIGQNGFEKNNNWYVPFLNRDTISFLQKSTDKNIQKFAGRLNHIVTSRGG